MRVEVTTEQVQQAVGFAKLPAARRIEAVGKTWIHSNFRVELADATSILLRCRTLNTGWDTLTNELTALRLAPPTLPLARNYLLVPPAIFGRPAALTTYIPGRDGGELTTTPEGREQLAEHIGSVIQALQAKPLPHFGTLGLGHSFGNRTATWREEWTLDVESSWARAQAAGATLGAVGVQVMDKVREGLPALDGVEAFTLVHRDLHPNNLRIDPQGGLAGVIDWSDALVGDPVVEWATLTQAAPAWFERIHRAAGSPSLERLPTYAASRVIQHLGFACLPLFDHDRGMLRALSLERAHLMARQALDGEHASLDETRVPIRRAVEALHHLPGVRPNNAVNWIGGLAAALLGGTWASWSTDLIDRVDLQNHLRPYGSSTREAVVERALGTLPQEPQGAFAVVAVALVAAADDRLDHTLDARIWSALGELVEGLARMEAELTLPDDARGLHARLGRAACTFLGATTHAERFQNPISVSPTPPAAPTSGTDALLPALAWALDQPSS